MLKTKHFTIFLVLFCLLSPSLSEECFTEQFTFFTVCVITVHYTGDPPTFEELAEMPNEERKDTVRPLICPCSEGSVGKLCPDSVFKFTEQFRHRHLCASYVPEVEEK